MFKLQRKWTLRQWNQVLLQVIVFYSGEKKLLCVKIKEDGIRSTIYKVPAKRTHRSINARLLNQNLCMDTQWVAKQIQSCFASCKKWYIGMCIGWPNGEKLSSTCIRIWARPKLMQVIAGPVKSTQVGGQMKHKLNAY